MDATKWYALRTEAVLDQLKTRAEGLTQEEAAQRLAEFGRNEIAHRKPISPARLLLRQFSNFFVWALLAAAVLAFAVSFMPGEASHRLTAYFILGIVVLSLLLNFFQEYCAQRELQALDRLLMSKARVLRSGKAHEINAEEVVPGDILLLLHGQKIPADARLLEADHLAADESALTGESMPVPKAASPVAENAPLAERASMVYASTYLTSGTGTAVVVRTGMATEVGAIAEALQKMAERPTPFQLEVRKMARHMSVLVAVAAVLVAAFLLFVLHESVVNVALNALSLAVATIPESLPIVLTFALALGAHQMAQRKVVVRQLAVVESLGSVDTICTDKTGTLTLNAMTVERLFAGGRIITLPGLDQADKMACELLRAGLLCNDATVEEGPEPKFSGDPVDIALLRAALAAKLDITRERADEPRVGGIPFTSERMMMTTVHRLQDRFIVLAKGAPEAILPRCATWRSGDGLADPLTEKDRETIRAAIERLEREGGYVLALALKDRVSQPQEEAAEQAMTFLGLVAMMDPPRPGTHEAVATAKQAGIRVIMITGDNALTARTVGRDLGIGERTVGAQELEPFSRRDLAAKMKEVDIVARATPQIKQRVLQALQDEGHFVAMTGDGVNDATALKQSDVGVAMGLRGTDIAKESANMVLLDDNFATIIAGIEEGRRIFDNIRKFSNYLLSTTLGSLVVVLALSLMGYFPLTPRMLLWVNLVTDLILASALSADPAVPGIMRRRPRRRDEPILNNAIYATIAGSVFRTLIVYVIIFWVGLRFGGVTYARTMLFTSIVLHAFTRVMVVRQLDNLSIWSNRAVLLSFGAAVGLQVLALYTPLRQLFGIVALDGRAWAVMVPAVVVSSAAGVYMTRWILKLVPLWSSEPQH